MICEEKLYPRVMPALDAGIQSTPPWRNKRGWPGTSPAMNHEK